jgi:hypothetical protein
LFEFAIKTKGYDSSSFIAALETIKNITSITDCQLSFAKLGIVEQFSSIIDKAMKANIDKSHLKEIANQVYSN